MSHKRVLIPLFIILTFVVQLMLPGAVLADDGIPPEPVATEVPVDPGAGEQESASVPEILEQAPAGTDVVVVNQNGTTEPLATQAAAEAIATSDPVWCPAGVTDPSDGLCTPSQASVTDLIAYLEDHAATYYGDGTIFFQAGVYGGSESSIFLMDTYDYDMDTFNDLGALGALTIYGGWDLEPTSLTYGDQLAGGTTFNVPVFIGWLSDVTVQDVIVNADTAGFSVGIVSGGDVVLDGVDASSNPSGSGASLDTCVMEDINPDPDIYEWACTGTGSVGILDSNFDGNAGDGLWVEAGGQVSTTLVSASNNGLWGAGLDNQSGSGGVLIGSSIFDNNGSQGLAVWTDGGISMDHSQASGNADGAQLDAADFISVTSSTFDGNGWQGLSAWAGLGDINLTSVSATGNSDGALLSSDQGNVTVFGGSFNNNTFPGANLEDGEVGLGLAAEAWNGNVTLTNVVATGNDVGAIALAVGSILITGDTDPEDAFTYSFSSNTLVGLAAWAEGGGVTLSAVTAVENGLAGGEGYGAWLMGYGSPIVVSGGIFDGNSQEGLFIESDGLSTDPDVFLDDVEAAGNGLKGVRIVYSAPCGTTTGGVTVQVSGGLFETNGAYGIYAVVGPQGDLVLDAITPPGFGDHNGNPTDSLYDVLVNTEVVPCPTEPVEPKPEPKPYLIIEVPEMGGLPVELNCVDYSGTLMILPDGSKVLLSCPAQGALLADALNPDELPGSIPGGPAFVSAMEISLMDGDQPVSVLTGGGSLLVAFPIPEDARPADRYAILYWDAAAQAGTGGWVELPEYRELLPGWPNVVPLHPDADPDDLMRILSGVRTLGGYIKAMVNFPGIFVLVRR